ncbi:RNase P modulator RnpM [Paenibacillus macerans]|uniref:RNase P modulator RnpM n=1 Tax=Paenibacillus macerans TaxID=44252 RepID=UPI002041BFF2|nr:YlxR family protein [Paenibacillus macerans]MCM3699100.1 YlxR family protein [Paenibacillus macerans]
MKQRKVPLRKCVACQQMMPKKSLIRIVRSPEGEVSIDLTGKKSGRGAYLCGKEACFKLAHKTKALDRALKAPVGPEVYEQLARDFLAVEEEFLAGQGREEDDDE